MSSNKIGIVVIGFGARHNFGWMHSTWIKASPRLKLIGICDLSEECRTAAKAAFPDVKIYSSTAQIWQDNEVDAVSIVTPNFTHCALALEAFANGRHVLTENAMALNSMEADKMVNAAKAAGKSLCVNHNRRHDGNYRIIKEIVDSGEIGEIFQIEIFPAWYLNPFKDATPDLWWGDKKRSGGLFFYYGSQAFDWILDLVPGNITGVNGFAQKRVWFNITNEDQVTAILKFDNGVVANFTESYIDASKRPFWRILGTKGAIVDWEGAHMDGYQKQINAPSCGNIDVIIGDIDGNRFEKKIPYKDSNWNVFYDDWAAHLLDGMPNPIPGEVGRRVLAIVDAAKESIETGQTVKPDWN
jgi:scyllo-inositol 2-dehydrogenase (NADP+)